MGDINGCLDSDFWVANHKERKYGCHRAYMLPDPFKTNETFCAYCRSVRPMSLQEQALHVNLKNAHLAKTLYLTLSHIPERTYGVIGIAINSGYFDQASRFLVEFLPTFDETKRYLFDVRQSRQTLLSRFIFYAEIYHKLKPYFADDSVDVMSDILLYLRNSKTKFSDFWRRISVLVKKYDGEVKKHSKVVDSTTRDGSCTVYVDTRVLIGRKDVPSSQQGKGEFRALKDIHKRAKTTAFPLIFRTSCIIHHDLNAHEIPTLLDNINPQDVSHVGLTLVESWTGELLDMLGLVLSECNNLRSVSLEQSVLSLESPDDVAWAVAKLLRYHSLLELKIKRIPLAGSMALYPLPPAEEWCLVNCNLMETDWRSMAARTDLTLKALTLSSEYDFTSHPGLLHFIEAQATSLVNLSVQQIKLTPREILSLVSMMARYNKLQELHLNCDHMDKGSLESLVVAFMSIEAAKRLFCEMSTREIHDEKQRHLSLAMKDFCSAHRCPPLYLCTIALSPVHFVSVPMWDD